MSKRMQLLLTALLIAVLMVSACGGRGRRGSSARRGSRLKCGKKPPSRLRPR